MTSPRRRARGSVRGGGAAREDMEGASGEAELPLLTVKHELRNANLTGHAEKVGIENFELLKVLGTGGKMHYF